MLRFQNRARARQTLVVHSSRARGTSSLNFVWKLDFPYTPNRRRIPPNLVVRFSTLAFFVPCCTRGLLSSCQLLWCQFWSR